MNAQDLLNKLIERKDLTADETKGFLDAVVGGEMMPSQIGAILVALRMKGESASEIEGLLRAMRAHMITIDAPGAIDVVGTGGDGSGTFNISTASAFVVAGAGVKVAKHGNRAASSKCGSADVLEALGVNINLTPSQAQEVFSKVGMVFMLAPTYHAALKNVVAVRKELKIRTIFNVLGPFANPAQTKRELVGVPNAEIAKKMAEVSRSLGYEHLLIVSSEDGLDEISLFAKSNAYEVKGDTVQAFSIDPATFGFAAASAKDILGGTAEENAHILRDVLGGKKGAARDIVILNSAYALYVAGAVKDAKEGIAKAAESIDSEKATQVLKNLVTETNAFRESV